MPRKTCKRWVTRRPPQDPSFVIDFTTNGRNPNPPERLGWGNDGAPLRDFALVAIAQHAPRTLTRLPGADFRVPTDEELDALVAYQLPLGRQEDFNLPSLELKSSLASTGKTLYWTAGTCSSRATRTATPATSTAVAQPVCRSTRRRRGSATATAVHAVSTWRLTTNVNDIPLALALGLPRDGGFRALLTAFGSFGNTEDFPPPLGRLELEEFNTPPVVESADTGPFFHNHTVKDLESAVAFYGTQAFQTSIQGRWRSR